MNELLIIILNVLDGIFPMIIMTSCSFLNPRSLVATARKKKYKSSVIISISIGRNKRSTEPVISQIAYIDNHILLVLWTSGEFGQKYMLFTCSFSNFHGGILDNWYSSNIDSILVSSSPLAAFWILDFCLYIVVRV